jgi:prephenate dehydrogenase (NADP+)
MGTAWFRNKYYPWEHGYYVGGIETVKVNIMLRIYSNSWHVYAGIAIMNPSARNQIDEYATSVTELFKLMISGDEKGLRERIYKARSLVFGVPGVKRRTPILLTEDIFDQFGLDRATSNSPSFIRPNSMPPLSQSQNSPPNSHLSLLAMVDCWARLGIQPFDHLDLAATPIFRMWIGVAEYLFHSPTRLDAAINAALSELSYRQDDLEFVIAAREWSQCISFGSFDLYRKRFVETRNFFETRFGEATKLGAQMIQAIIDSTPTLKES